MRCRHLRSKPINQHTANAIANHTSNDFCLVFFSMLLFASIDRRKNYTEKQQLRKLTMETSMRFGAPFFLVSSFEKWICIGVASMNFHSYSTPFYRPIFVFVFLFVCGTNWLQHLNRMSLNSNNCCSQYDGMTAARWYWIGFFFLPLTMLKCSWQICIDIVVWNRSTFSMW